MSRLDKEFQNRMEGMIYAFNIAKNDGVDALEKDIRKRNILRAPMKFTQADMDKYWDELSANIYSNMLTAVCYTLNVVFGYGPKRIGDFKRQYDKVVQDALDLDYMGEHYIKLEDYAVELNEKFNMGIDVTRVAMCQDVYDESDKKYHTLRAEKVISELKENGYVDAAEFLEKKLG